MFEASIEPLLVAPAPTMVWISSMNKIAFSLFCSSAITDLSLCSKSPLYLVPARSPPKSSMYIRAFSRKSGTLPSAICWARPSAMAVLPTPGSPTKTGLFFLRRHRTCIVRSISISLPIKGSSLPQMALSTRSTQNVSRASASFFLFFLPVIMPVSEFSLNISPPALWEITFNTSSRVMPSAARKYAAWDLRSSSMDASMSPT